MSWEGQRSGNRGQSHWLRGSTGWLLPGHVSSKHILPLCFRDPVSEPRGPVQAETIGNPWGSDPVSVPKHVSMQAIITHQLLFQLPETSAQIWALPGDAQGRPPMHTLPSAFLQAAVSCHTAPFIVTVFHIFVPFSISVRATESHLELPQCPRTPPYDLRPSQSEIQQKGGGVGRRLIRGSCFFPLKALVEVAP